MKKRILLNENQILDSMYQVLLFFFFIIPGIFLDNFFSNETLNKLFYYVFGVFVISVMKISRRVSIVDGKVVKDINIMFLGKLKEIVSFPISEIEEIFLDQNEENYYEITAKRKSNSNFVIKTLPNKNQALVEMNIIKQKLNILS